MKNKIVGMLAFVVAAAIVSTMAVCAGYPYTTGVMYDVPGQGGVAGQTLNNWHTLNNDGDSANDVNLGPNFEFGDFPQDPPPSLAQAESWDDWMDRNLHFFNNDFEGLAGWSSLIDWGEGWADFQEDVNTFFCESVVLATADCWIAEACEVDNLTADPDATGFLVLASGETGAWIDAERTQNLIPLECNETGGCPDTLFCKGGLCYFNDVASGDDVIAMDYMYELTYYLYNPGNDDDDDDDNMSHKICYTLAGGEEGCLWEFKDFASETEVLEGESYSFYGSSAVPLYSPADIEIFCLKFDPPLEMIGGTEVDSTCTGVYKVDFEFYTNPAGVPSSPSGGSPFGGFFR